MIIEPKIRGFICTTAHPAGCAQHIQEQIDYVRSNKKITGPKNVLVIGSSTGYGLASRIVATFGCGAQTIGVFYEREADGKRTATAGWYNMAAFEKKSAQEGFYAKSFNGDGFSDEMRKQVIETIKNDWGSVDLIIYSLAAPRRQHPRTGVVYKSILKPIGKEYTNHSIDMSKNLMEEVTLPPATEEEIEHTTAVMGGEDWKFWIDALEEENLLADGAITVAYSYVGPDVTQAVYRNGTIGRAKEHLEATAKELDERFKKINGRALISVNKALVTQSSSAIPFIPLYFIVLSKVMKEKGIDENCVEQIYRLFSECIYNDQEIPVDNSGMIRLDDQELRKDVQDVVNQVWDSLTQDILFDVTDVEGYHVDFLKLFGFGLEGVQYDKDIDPHVKIPSIK